MASYVDYLYDALAMIQSLKYSARTLLGEEDDRTKKRYSIEENLNEAGAPPAENTGRIEEFRSS
jgi:hypothetical protein